MKNESIEFKETQKKEIAEIKLKKNILQIKREMSYEFITLIGLSRKWIEPITISCSCYEIEIGKDKEEYLEQMKWLVKQMDEYEPTL